MKPFEIYEKKMKGNEKIEVAQIFSLAILNFLTNVIFKKNSNRGYFPELMQNTLFCNHNISYADKIS